MAKINELVRFEDIWDEAIVNPMKAITVANGYENDLCFLNGWLVHYALDISRGLNGWSFPSVGVHSDEEIINIQARGSRHDPISSENTRSFTIDVAVDVVSDRETLLARMESALRDVKRAIATVKTRNVTLTRAKFQIPEDSEIYAFIIISGEIKFNEQW